MQTDASNATLGAVLTQEHGGVEHPITSASGKLNKAKTRYTTIEREYLAIKWGIKHFQYYLMGREFCLPTDHAPLKWLCRTKTDDAYIMQWVFMLQPFKLTSDYRPGDDNKVAGFLSRYGEHIKEGRHTVIEGSSQTRMTA